jgi:hypothetical protein
MFNRKKIKTLKENLKMVNDQRLQLRNENIIYQKELMALRDMVLENNKMLKQLTEKKKPKKDPKELSKAYKKVVKKNER